MTERLTNRETHLIALAEKAAEQLAGTCGTLARLGDEYEEAENEDAFCNRLDELVFECTRCNWWHEQSEMSEHADDEWFCTECEND